MNLISKKDLLLLTGISYGQLYRWKRQGLIPEEWFLKQASYTGQETFFPREQMLSRVRLILEMKEQHSLEELVRMFSPESAAKTLAGDMLAGVQGVDAALVQRISTARGSDAYEVQEAVVMLAVARALRSCGAQDEDIAALACRCMGQRMSGKELLCMVLRAGDEYHAIFATGQVWTDAQVVSEQWLDELKREIKMVLTQGK